MIERNDDFAKKREHIKNLSDEELKNRFWELAERIVEPLVELAKTHTSPSIERSVLLRMGFDSIQSKAITKKVIEANLLGKGAGNVVLRFSKKHKCSIEKAGERIINGESLEGLF